jgi:homoserine kinase
VVPCPPPDPAEPDPAAARSAAGAPRARRVRVPGSTSNLGPGFDLLGLAFDLWLTVEVRPRRAGGPRLARLEGEATAWPRGAENLLLRAFDATLTELGGDPERFEFDVASEIPVSRGLGSSGAAVVAGLELACVIAGTTLPEGERLRRALELEGHPDNVSPALLGGCVLAVPLPGAAPLVVRQALHPSLAFSVAWPAATLPTQLARSLLPTTVSFADARENPRRLALLLEGLRTADPALLAAGGEDRLHARYRLPHIPGGAEALEAAHAAGAWLATISGSGSALVALSSQDHAPRVAAAMRAAFERASGPAGGRVVRVVESATRVE